MKRILIAAILLVLLVPFTIFAVGTVTESYYLAGTTEKSNLTVQWYFLGDNPADTATSDALTAILKQGWYLFMVTTIPSGPTDNYDIYLNDALDNDLMGGAGENRDQNGTEYAVPVILSGSTTGMGCRYVIGPLVFTLSGNSAASATGTATFFFSKP